MSYSLAQSTLDLLSKKIITRENAKRAREYISEKRNLDPSKFLYTPFLTSDLSKFVQTNSSIFYKDWLSDSLYFPITSAFDPNLLIGFDVRYVGSSTERTRYYKIKVDKSSLFCYNSKSLFEKKEILFVCEGILDLETLRFLNSEFNQFSSSSYISPLTCLTNPNYLNLLLMSYFKIVICYDNDQAGNNSKKKIMNYVKNENLKSVYFLDYLGKDLNDAYKTLPISFLKNSLERLSNSIKSGK